MLPSVSGSEKERERERERLKTCMLDQNERKKEEEGKMKLMGNKTQGIKHKKLPQFS